MNRLKIVTVCGTALLIAATVAIGIASRNRQQPLPPPEVPVAAYSAEVCVKAVERNSAANVATAALDSSRAVAIVCGADPTTANCYEARNDAFRSIARRRDLPEKDVAALMAYLRSKDNAMRPERIAALKNDVMNLLRNQEPPPKGLTEALLRCLGVASIRPLFLITAYSTSVQCKAKLLTTHCVIVFAKY